MFIPLWVLGLAAIFVLAAGYAWGYKEGERDGYQEGHDAASEELIDAAVTDLLLGIWL